MLVSYLHNKYQSCPNVCICRFFAYASLIEVILNFKFLFELRSSRKSLNFNVFNELYEPFD